MSENNQCACHPSNLVMLPVRGFGLAVDAGGLAPVPTPTAGRERVDQDMHIHINGNLETSGDGLSPETAVKSFEDAVLALSRYDGCNQYSATFHFADLADPEVTYPDMNVFTHSYATFRALSIDGVSHETTRLGTITLTAGTYATLANISSAGIITNGWLLISGKIALKPISPGTSSFQANWGGLIRFLADSEVYLYPGKYHSVMYSDCGLFSVPGTLKFHVLNSIQVQYGFVRARGNACVRLNKSVDFSTCSAVTGQKYNLTEQACLVSAGLTLPGSLLGVAANGSIYV